MDRSKSLDRVIPKQAWGLHDREAAEVDRKAGRKPPERWADLPYVVSGPVPERDVRRVFTAGYWKGWGMSVPSYDNPYRPETPYGALWLDGYEEGRRVRLVQLALGQR